MKINNLLGEEAHTRLISNGANIKYRCLGTSTMMAFEYIAMAYEKPNRWVRISDHFPSHNADRCLLDNIRDMLDKIGYKYFKYKVVPPSIKFELYKETDENI